MAINKNALIRYKTIDKCLQNHYRKWTLDDLIEACSDALYDFEGRDINVSKRTIQLDIQNLRSDKFGYNAPIVVYDKKYYKYEDIDYSITDIPLNETDMNILSESVEVLKQFKDFSLFNELGGIIQRLEDKVYTEKCNQKAIIHLDKNENLKGLEHLDVLYQSILKKIVLSIEYQSFTARKPGIIHFHPFILKEFNNRWFVIGKKDNDKYDSILTLALDRIIKIEYNLYLDYNNENFDADEYYKNTLGVTVLDEKYVRDIELKFNKYHAPYVITKPIHHSQKIKEKHEDGSVTFSLKLHTNFELERQILGFGEAVEVLKPQKLRNKIKNSLKNALGLYE